MLFTSLLVYDYARTHTRTDKQPENRIPSSVIADKGMTYMVSVPRHGHRKGGILATSQKLL